MVLVPWLLLQVRLVSLLYLLQTSPFVTALTAAQIAVIASQQFVGKKGGLIPEYGRGGMVHGPSHANGGVKFNAGGRVVELEGGEARYKQKVN